jgi:prepilin peptidase CpaA
VLWLWHWIVVLLVAIAAVWDLRTREVPDWIPAAVLGCGLMAALVAWTGAAWLAAAAGFVLGLALTWPLFALGGLEGGDVKLLAAVGCALGPKGLLCAMFWMALAGGALALVYKARGKKDLAYVPAIAPGVLVETVWPGGIANVLLR